MFANLTEPNSITASTGLYKKLGPLIGRGRAFDRMTAGLRLCGCGASQRSLRQRKR